MAASDRGGIIAMLEELSRQRALSPDESAVLERAIRSSSPKRQVWHWTAREDRMLQAVIRKRAKLGPLKPFSRNAEVQKLANRLGRSYMAVHRRMERLRKKKCSRARKRAMR